MLSKYIQPGFKVEIQPVERQKSTDSKTTFGRGGGTGNPDHSEKKIVYHTKVYDILTEDRLELLMPMEQTKLVLLQVDKEYDFYFYTEGGLYQCFGQVIDRYKDKSVYLLVVELTSNLRKYQRREYYRFSCALEMQSRLLEEEGADQLGVEEWSPGLPLQRSVVVDISGGGLRFIANYAYDPEVLISCRYYLSIEGKNKEYNLVGKVLSVKELENRPGVFEHRVQYTKIDTVEREEIIRFIFEEERKSRRKQKGI